MCPDGIELETLAYWDDALTNWATQPGLDVLILPKGVANCGRQQKLVKKLLKNNDDN